MNPKIVVFSVLGLILVVAIVFIINPERVEEVRIPVIDEPVQEKVENETKGFFGGFFGGGGGGFFGGRGGSSGGGGGSGGGGSGPGGTQATTSIIIGGNTSTTSSTTTTVIGGTTTTSTTTSTSTSTTTTSTTTTTVIGGTTTTSTTTSTTSITGCPSNFLIDYSYECKGTTGSQDDEVFVKITNNEINGFSFDVYVDNSLEASNIYVNGFGSLKGVYSNVMTTWWKQQTGSASRTFNVRLDYLTSCSKSQDVTVVFQPAECLD